MSAQQQPEREEDGPGRARGRVLELGGLRIHGLDLASLQEASLSLTMPLHPGNHFVLPHLPAPVEVKVQQGTVASLSIRIDRPAGSPRIREAKLDFTRPVIVSNPASALKPLELAHNATLSRAANWFADAVADMHVDGLFVDGDGTVHVPGHISKLGFKSDLEPEVKGAFPRLNLELEQIAREGLVAAPLEALPAEAASPGGALASQGLQALLEALGRIAGEASFTIDARTDATAVRLEAHGASVETGEEPLRLRIEGRAQLDRDGFLHLRLTEPEALRLDCGAATVKGQASFDVLAATLEGRGHAALELSTRKLSAFLAHSGVKVRYCPDPGGTITARADVQRKDGRTSLAGGEGHWRLTGSCAQVGIDIDHEGDEGVALGFDDLRVVSAGHTGFAFDGGLFTTSDGACETTLDARDIKANVAGIDVVSPGAAHAEFRSDAFAFDGRTLAWRGSLMFEIAGLLRRSIRWEADGRGLTLDGQELVHTLPLDLDGFPDRIVKPGAPGFGSVADAAGLAGLSRRIAEVTGHPVRENNSVRLLPEGELSQQERLRLIGSAGAGDKLCVQTLIFKDDETGTTNAEALAAAQRRGAEVAVLIDTLGNIAGLEELVEGKRIYATMRRAGVKVELYNSAGAAGLQKLLNICAIHDSLPALASLEQLSSPALAIAFFSQLAKAANGEGASAATRAAVRSALADLSSSLSAEDAAAFVSAIKPHGHLSAEELAALVRFVAVLNHRTHQKRLALVRADGTAEAVVGGRNIADEYLFQKGRLYRSGVRGERRPAWRDTDLHIAGAAARDVFDGMRPIWRQVTDRDLPPLPPHRDGPGPGTSLVQSVEDRPHPDGHHNILNAEIEIANSLGQGDLYYAANAYLCMEGAMARLKEAFIAAAGRGAEIHLLTNSTDTTDIVDVNTLGVFSYRELLRAGIRIYERKVEEPLEGATHGGRTIHSKTAVARRRDGAGAGVARISSWNKDNRSACLNAENAAYVWGDSTLNQELEAAILHDISEAREILLAEIERRPYGIEIRASLRLMALGKVL